MAFGCTLRRNDTEVVAHGALIFKTDDVVQITNVPGIENIKIYFKVKFIEDAAEKRTYSDLTPNEESACDIVLKLKWFENENNNSTANNGLNFASTNDADYIFNYSFRTYGYQDNYINGISFQILRRLKS